MRVAGDVGWMRKVDGEGWRWGLVREREGGKSRAGGAVSWFLGRRKASGGGWVVVFGSWDFCRCWVLGLGTSNLG